MCALRRSSRRPAAMACEPKSPSYCSAFRQARSGAGAPRNGPAPLPPGGAPVTSERARDKNLHFSGRAELLLCPEFLGGAEAPPYRWCGDFCHAPRSKIHRRKNLHKSGIRRNSPSDSGSDLIYEKTKSVFVVDFGRVDRAFHPSRVVRWNQFARTGNQLQFHHPRGRDESLGGRVQQHRRRLFLAFPGKQRCADDEQL